jgi:hypothetical protein
MAYKQQVTITLTQDEAACLRVSLDAACEHWGVDVDAAEPEHHASAAGRAQILRRALTQVSLGNKDSLAMPGCSYRMVAA